MAHNSIGEWEAGSSTGSMKKQAGEAVSALDKRDQKKEMGCGKAGIRRSDMQ